MVNHDLKVTSIDELFADFDDDYECELIDFGERVGEEEFM